MIIDESDFYSIGHKILKDLYLKDSNRDLPDDYVKAVVVSDKELRDIDHKWYKEYHRYTYANTPRDMREDLLDYHKVREVIENFFNQNDDTIYEGKDFLVGAYNKYSMPVGFVPVYGARRVDYYRDTSYDFEDVDFNKLSDEEYGRLLKNRRPEHEIWHEAPFIGRIYIDSREDNEELVARAITSLIKEALSIVYEDLKGQSAPFLNKIEGVKANMDRWKTDDNRFSKYFKEAGFDEKGWMPKDKLFKLFETPAKVPTRKIHKVKYNIERD